MKISKILQFNTPVAALMELSNAIGDIDIEPESADDGTRSARSRGVDEPGPDADAVCPHTAEELFSVWSGNDRRYAGK
jgi:hypothetical protein